MKLLTAKQHGAWAMLIIPFLLSMIIGGARWEHSLLFIAWLCIYLSSYPLLMSLKGKNRGYYLKWFVIYSIPALIFLVYPVIVEPQLFYFGISFIPTFLINIYFAITKNERAFINDVVAIINFCIGGLASYFFGAGQIDETAWIIFVYSFLFSQASFFTLRR